MFVVDSSALGCVVLPDERGPATRAVLDALETNRAVAPTHLPVEVASMIWSAERRGRITEPQRMAACEAAEEVLGAASLYPPPPMRKLVSFALRHSLTVYDASFAYLALELQCPMMTFDAALVRAAETLDIELLRP